MDDTRIVLEEQNEKNEHLERKFRKVDSELIEVGRKSSNYFSVHSIPVNDKFRTTRFVLDVFAKTGSRLLVYAYFEMFYVYLLVKSPRNVNIYKLLYLG